MANRLATPGELCTLAPEFANVPPEVTTAWLEAAGQDINLAAWGDKASEGHIFLTAHYMQVGGWGDDAGERGPVTAEQIDKIRVQYGQVGTATGLDANYSTTKWGRLYLAKKKTIFVAGMVGRRFLLTP